jgi:hypothetical protein
MATGHKVLRKMTLAKYGGYSDVARKIGTTQSTLRSVLAGRLPDVALALRCRDRVGIPLEHWLDDVDEWPAAGPPEPEEIK